MSLCVLRRFHLSPSSLNISSSSISSEWPSLPKTHQHTCKYKRSTHPTSVPLKKLFLSQFPLSIKKSVADYAFRNNPIKFQHDLLATLPFYPEADLSGRLGRLIQTKLLNGLQVNEFAIYPPAFHNKSLYEQSELYRNANHLIMVHGYGGGLGYWLKNFEKISSMDNWVIHAVDLVGYGCSLRPKFEPKKGDINGVEEWFHDPFLEWLELRHLTETPEKNLVLGHLMGAYLMASYAINKRPSFCKKLLMVSPGAVIKHRTKVPVPSYFAKLWEQNISPFSLVRNAGPLGSKLVSMWSSRRFANLDSQEADLLHKYSYGIFQAPGSGEYMLNYMLAPGADARHPLIERGVHKLQCDVLWCYGEEDWMDRTGGKMCSDILNRVSGHSDKSSVIVIPNAGHHIYLDNISEFNRMVVDEMKRFS